MRQIIMTLVAVVLFTGMLYVGTRSMDELANARLVMNKKVGQITYKVLETIN